METAALLTFGFITGIKHALESDHIATVTAIMTRNKKLSNAMMIGGWWGIGHTATLMLAGIAVLLFGLTIPQKLAVGVELLVALLLVSLGVVNLRVWVKQQVHLHFHAHDERNHYHLHGHEGGDDPHDHAHSHRTKSFFTGMLHGAAGSAALSLLILSTIKSLILGLTYIVIFGVGSIFGMMLFSLLLGFPLKFASGRLYKFERLATAFGGVFSLFVGLMLVRQLLPQIIA